MKSRNFKMQIINVTAGAADAEFTVTHQFDGIPAEAIQLLANANARLYKSGTAWTATLAYFKSDVASAQFIVAFI